MLYCAMNEMAGERRISIIIPAYNEATRISSTIKEVWGYANRKFEYFEIIVVNDGSTDDTDEIVSSLAESMAHVKLFKQSVNTGKGASIKKGVLSTSTDFVLTCDADLSTPIEELETLFLWMSKGFDIVIGSRGMPESEIIQRQPWYREKMGKIFNMLVRFFVLKGIKDTQCGFKLFKGEVARHLFRKSKINRFSFDVEILYLAKKIGFRFKETPVRWADSPNSKVKVFFDSMNMLGDLFKIKMYGLLGLYSR